MYCIVKECGSVWNPTSNIIFHSFPRDLDKRQKWLSIIPLKGKFYVSAKICSLHFKPEDYDPKRPKRLLNSAVPVYSVQLCSCGNSVKACSTPSKCSPSPNVMTQTKTDMCTTVSENEHSYCKKVTMKTENRGSEDEQHEETIEVYSPYPQKTKKMKPVPKRKKEVQDTTDHSFTTLSEKEQEETCSLMDSVEEPLISAYSLNATAMYWSEKLDNLDPTQRLYAEKFINEILLEAQLGNLGRHSVVINGGDQTRKIMSAVDLDCTSSTSSNNS